MNEPPNHETDAARYAAHLGLHRPKGRRFIGNAFGCKWVSDPAIPANVLVAVDPPGGRPGDPGVRVTYLVPGDTPVHVTGDFNDEGLFEIRSFDPQWGVNMKEEQKPPVEAGPGGMKGEPLPKPEAGTTRGTAHDSVIMHIDEADVPLGDLEETMRRLKETPPPAGAFAVRGGTPEGADLSALGDLLADHLELDDPPGDLGTMLIKAAQLTDAIADANLRITADANIVHVAAGEVLSLLRRCKRYQFVAESPDPPPRFNVHIMVKDDGNVRSFSHRSRTDANAFVADYMESENVVQVIIEETDAR